jgi:hypothetical protein
MTGAEGLLYMNDQKRISFTGVIRAVQPRSTVWRYRLDNRTHNVIGFNLFLRGAVDDGEEHTFAVAISSAQQGKNHFHIGDEIKGTAWTKKYPKWEYADFYRAGNLKKTNSVTAEEESAPPWTGETPAVEKYNWRGCRMLARRNWGKRCFTCKWAAMANVAIKNDWGRRQKYRFESFCYGPRSCPFYDMGAPRAVPYKDCGEDYDQGWMDDICTQNRKDDDE